MAEQELTGTGELARRRPGRPSLSNEQLLDKALDLFLEKGFAGTSIDAITAAAGMAKRTVYARYGDKEALFKAALTRAIDEWLVPIERLRAEEGDDFEASLTRIGTILVANVLSPAGLRLLRLTNSESVSMPEVALDNVRRGTEPTLAYLADLFRRRLGGPDGSFPEADDAAQAFLSIVVSGPASNAAWGMRMDPTMVDSHTRYAVRLFLHGVLASTAGAGSEATASPGLALRAGGDDAESLRRMLREVEQALDEARSRIAQAGRLVGE